MKKIVLLIMCTFMMISNISYAGLIDMPPATHRDSNNEIVLDSYSHGQSVFLKDGIVVVDNDMTIPYSPKHRRKVIVYKLNFDASYILFKEFIIIPMLVEIPANTDTDLRLKVAFLDPQSTGKLSSGLQSVKLTEFTTKNMKFMPLRPITELNIPSDLQYYVWQAVGYIQNPNSL